MTVMLEKKRKEEMYTVSISVCKVTRVDFSKASGWLAGWPHSGTLLFRSPGAVGDIQQIKGWGHSRVCDYFGCICWEQKH